MNCKPSQDCMVTRKANGKLFCPPMVKTLYLRPDREFVYPDGYPGTVTREPGHYWVCESLGSDFVAPVGNYGATRRTRYAAVPDEYLRPINPGTLPEEVETEEEITA